MQSLNNGQRTALLSPVFKRMQNETANKSLRRVIFAGAFDLTRVDKILIKKIEYIKEQKLIHGVPTAGDQAYWSIPEDQNMMIY